MTKVRDGLVEYEKSLRPEDEKKIAERARELWELEREDGGDLSEKVRALWDSTGKS